MLVILGSALSLVLIGAVIYAEFRSAACGVALSNGVEVLVSPETYRAILERYRTGSQADELERWDRAVLETLRPIRPQEWRYLARSLGYQTSEPHGPRRRRQTAIH